LSYKKNLLKLKKRLRESGVSSSLSRELRNFVLQEEKCMVLVDDMVVLCRSGVVYRDYCIYPT